jgi:hypothetical protein
VAFLGDSLRQAESLVVRLKELNENSTVQELNEHFERLEQRVTEAQAESEAISSLLHFDWAGAFSSLPEWLNESVTAEDDALYSKTSNALAGSITNWFSESSSLRTLVNDDLGLLLRSMQAEVISNLTTSLRRRIHQGSIGIELPDSISNAAEASGLDMRAIGGSALTDLDGGSALEDVHIPLGKSAIPVRKGFWDFVLFRNQSKMRARLFGTKFEHRLDRNTKSKRLGEVARTYIQAEAEDYLYRYYPKATERLSDWISQSFTHYAVSGILSQLETALASANAELEGAQSELAQVAALRESLLTLSRAIEAADRGFGTLAERYGNTQPEMLLVEVEGAEEEKTGDESEMVILEEPAPE